VNINLVGVLVDGPDRASGIPDNPRKALTWPLGTTVVIRLDVKSRQSGAPVDLTGATVQLEARLQPLPFNQPKLLSVVASPLYPVVRGACQLVIYPTAQKQIMQQNIGRCFYDVWMVDVLGNRNAIIPTSPLILEPSVTEIT